MSTAPRYTINRSIIILHYKQPFLDWLMGADPNPPTDMTLGDLGNDGDAFMIPGDNVVDGMPEAVKWVEKHWRMLFEHILEGWLVDESLWPQKRTLKMFREWFAIEYRSMVWDLVNAPIVIEDWEEGEDDAESTEDTLH